MTINKAPRTPFSVPHDARPAAKRSRLSLSTAPNLNQVNHYNSFAYWILSTHICPQTIVQAPVPGAYAEAFDLRAMSKQPKTTEQSSVASLEAHATRDADPPASLVGQFTGARIASTSNDFHVSTTASVSTPSKATKDAASSTTINPSAEEPKVDFVAAFLANLDVDLSAHHDALVKCHLGTARDVVSRRDWPVEWFRIILDREVPGMSVFERFALARAFKLIRDDGSVQKSFMRVGYPSRLQVALRY